MKFNIKRVSLSDIDRDNPFYRITTRESVDDVADSIACIGLIHPPFVLERAASRYTIVSGFRRIEAFRRLKRPEIDVAVIASDTRPGDCVMLAVAENSLQRPLNQLEQSRAYRLLYGCFREDQEVEKISKALKLPSTLTIIHKLKRLCDLPPAIQQAILSETISMPTAFELNKLTEPEGLRFIRLFTRLKLSLNKQRQVMNLAGEISAREGISISDVLDDTVLQAVLENEEMDRGHKSGKTISLLKKRRFPEISRFESEFECNMKQLKLGKEIKLIPPPHFEGTVYTLSLQFEDRADLLRRRKTIDQMLENPVFTRIIKK